MTGAPSGRAQSGPGAVVLARTARLERRVRRGLTAQLVLQTSLTFLLLAGGLTIGALAGWTVLAFVLPVLALQALLWGLTIRWWRVERNARDFRLWFASDGLGYTCGAGTFPAGWDAVRAVRIDRARDGRARAVRVTAERWGGPAIVAWRGRGTARLPLQDQRVAAYDLADSLHRLSGGRVLPTVR